MTTRSSPSEPHGPDDAARLSGSPGDIERSIADARAGCPDSLGQLVERCRQYLLLVANKELNADLQGKVGASDLVQETLLTAQKIFGRFTGTSENELRQWARRILLNKIAGTWRRYGQTAKRDIHREQQLVAVDGLDEWFNLADQADTPRTIALANEQASAVQQIVDRLPERYRQVIALRCFERRSFVEIGEQLQISADAARKTWCRAIEHFRREWEASDESA